ncbi:MAG TPA: dihydrofolate reductase family protein [Conexibacter sp.]|nr:dihydrofolate reductase family protein [Conexibacter sp.]
MRKVTASFFMSLDGVVDAPHEWHFPYMDQEAQADSQAGVAGVDTILLGRVTYEEWAGFWPAQGSSNPMAEFFNTTPKLVASTTRDSLEWPGSTLIAGDVPAAVEDVKQQPGEEIAIYGSGALVRSLLRADLIDELRLMIHPIVVGRGKHLFEDGGEPKGLELVDSKIYATGLLSMTYRPAGSPS